MLAGDLLHIGQADFPAVCFFSVHFYLPLISTHNSMAKPAELLSFCANTLDKIARIIISNMIDPVTSGFLLFQ